MAYDQPYRVEPLPVPGQRVYSFSVVSTEGTMATCDQFWKARRVCDALNKLALERAVEKVS